METEKKDVEIVPETKSSTVVKFSRSYTYGGKTYEEVNLTALETLTANDMIEAEKHLSKIGIFSPTPELTLEYVFYIASKAAQMPIDFFRKLLPGDAIRLKNIVTAHFYGEIAGQIK